jgi:hypothetical protein
MRCISPQLTSLLPRPAFRRTPGLRLRYGQTCTIQRSPWHKQGRRHRVPASCVEALYRNSSCARASARFSSCVACALVLHLDPPCAPLLARGRSHPAHPCRNRTLPHRFSSAHAQPRRELCSSAAWLACHSRVCSMPPVHLSLHPRSNTCRLLGLRPLLCASTPAPARAHAPRCLRHRRTRLLPLACPILAPFAQRTRSRAALPLARRAHSGVAHALSTVARCASARALPRTGSLLRPEPRLRSPARAPPGPAGPRRSRLEPHAPLSRALSRAAAAPALRAR